MTILQDFLKDLAELVNIDAGTRNAAGVTKAAEIMKRHYESIGFHAELVDLSPDCGKALLATNRPGADHYDIMLNAHLDTVFPDGTAAARPFRFDDVRPTVQDVSTARLGFSLSSTASKPPVRKILTDFRSSSAATRMRS